MQSRKIDATKIFNRWIRDDGIREDDKDYWIPRFNKSKALVEAVRQQIVNFLAVRDEINCEQDLDQYFVEKSEELKCHYMELSAVYDYEPSSDEEYIMRQLLVKQREELDSWLDIGCDALEVAEYMVRQAMINRKI